MCCGVGHRCGLDLALLCLWRRPAATAPIRLLAWEPPYAARVALKSQKTKRKKWMQLSDYSFDSYYLSVHSVSGLASPLRIEQWGRLTADLLRQGIPSSWGDRDKPAPSRQLESYKELQRAGELDGDRDSGEESLLWEESEIWTKKMSGKCAWERF